MNFDIVQVAELLGMIDKNTDINASAFNVTCPCCGKKKLNITRKKDAWRCNCCGVHGGMLELYVRFGLGEETYTKKLGRQAVREIEQKLGRNVVYKQRKKPVYVDDTTKLSDSELDKIYSKLVTIPALQLSNKHRAALIKDRGINASAVTENEYRTLPEELWFPNGKRWSLDEFKKEGIDKVRENTPELKKIKVNHIIAGLYIGVYMNNYLGINLDSVPGFFKIKDLWCFRYTPGLLIPMRNIKGEIIGFQVRTDSGKLRYMTVSSKGFNNGTSGGARIHFPLHNPEITADTVIRLTEGPLKADVALSMTKDANVAYIAIMGVNSTKELPKVLQELRHRGCMNIKNALDMDKLTNPNVINGVKNIKQMIKKSGLRYSQMCWDELTARLIFAKQQDVLKANGIKVTYSSNDVFVKVLTNTLELNNRGVKMPKEWINPATKGVDDYLKSISA